MVERLIQAEDIGKRYRLGVLNANSLKEDLSLWWKRLRHPSQAVPDASYFWALRDVSFEINRGDVVGLIGKNGAGKSTLLKIMSRVAKPTEGVISGNGRIASLLEVGTGFHPELTGRENIYLNGAILGMKKVEIARLFDEIVAFSEIEEFLDTPVKRYSSGMYIRLAFSIAIHLVSDILILDEVLSVGDFDFQQKCMKKIESLAKGQSRTIIFVSHSMQSVISLCNTALYLEKGKLIAQGDARTVAEKYLLRENVYVHKQEYPDPSNAPGNNAIRIARVALRENRVPVSGPIDARAAIRIEFSLWNMVPQPISLITQLVVINFLGECIFSLSSPSVSVRNGSIVGSCDIPASFLGAGSYVMHLLFVQENIGMLYEFNSCLSFEVQRASDTTQSFGKWSSPVHPDFPISVQQADGYPVNLN